MIRIPKNSGKKIDQRKEQDIGIKTFCMFRQM